MEKLESKQNANKDAWDKEYQENIKKGIFYCKHVEQVGLRRCKCSFMSKQIFDGHENDGEYKYPSQNIVDEAACTVAKGRGILALGSRRNTRVEYV